MRYHKFMGGFAPWTAWFKKHIIASLIILLVVLLVPTFWRMLKPGIFSMHDFHVIRLYQYDKCIKDLVFPCRWAPDSAFGYGEPLFNFYAQLPYISGEVFVLLGFSILDSIKILFILSLVLSSIAMFFLGRQIWGSNLGALLAALVYSYAPYRAVDVWVRGALPEALAFIFFPLITYFFNDYILKRKINSLLLFSLSFAGLILTHNLSVLMYLIFLSFWGIYFLTKHKAWGLVPKFIMIGLLSFGLVAFYALPVAFESKFITLTQGTTEGYYDFKNHYTTLNQLLISRYWGYGASLWGEDDRLSLSVGQIQWILPLLIAFLIFFRKKIRYHYTFFLLLILGWLMLFLTHNKSTPLWDLIKLLSFIQFPWRFLGSAVFIFSLSAGALPLLLTRKISRYVVTLIIILLIGINTSFFFEDLWFNYSDKEHFSGKSLELQVGSAINDFWPKTGGKDVPNDFVPKEPILPEGNGSGILLEKKSHSAKYELDITSNQEVSFPIVYFPGWTSFSDGKKVDTYPRGKYGLISAKFKPEDKNIQLKFTDTPIRVIGNIISLASLIIVLFIFASKNRLKI